MKLTDCLLTTCDLYPDENKPEIRLAVMGTCVAEHMVNAASSKNIMVELYLWETWNNLYFPDIDTNQVDGIIIHITLRAILAMAAIIEGGDISYFTLGDVSYINSPVEELSNIASEIMTSRIDSVVQNFAGVKPLFFLSFIEPHQTSKGFFHNNRADSVYRLVRNLNDAMAQHLSEISGAYYVEVNDLLSYYGCGDSADSYHQHFIHAGNFGTQQSELFYLGIIQRVINALETLRAQNSIKLIITDLDNTLWRGVPAEEDEVIPEMHIEGWPIGYIEALLECKRRGILLAVSSKNNEIETINNFIKICGKRIQPEDFVSLKINWKTKSENIKEILDELNILPSNVLFIDDNPLEIEEVSRAFPEIRTLSLPQQRWRNVLLHSPQLQTHTLTEESKNRTNLLKAKIERDKISASIDMGQYLHSLNFKVRVTIITDTDHHNFPRTIELINKTNQFNTTGKRWTDTDMKTFLGQSECVIYAANVEDILTNHGLVAIAIVSGAEIVQFILSCRIFGIGIETALLRRVMLSIPLKETDSVIAYAKDTGRNASSRDFYSDHGFILLETEADGTQKWIGRDLAAEPSWIQTIDV